MADNSYRALVVDDEAMVRNLTIRALNREGFSCDAAADGLEARQRMKANRYDVVVSDLQMPNMHGHLLASELLLSEGRPIVVILTGVLEPKLAKDLLVRGADSIEFKPVNYNLFAAKVKAMVTRRRECLEIENVEAGGQSNGSEPEAADVERKLAHLSKILPVSPAAFDVFRMTGSDSYPPSQIAAAISRDASLSVDVLRLANSSFYNCSGTKILELHDAVVRIGQKRIGEIALATSALAAITANVLPWINVDLTWRRSVAAGVAIDLLLSQGKYPGAEDGLFLGAIMHPLGRLALGMLFARRYQAMVKTCEEGDPTLEDQEEHAFPLTPGQAMGCLLKAWNIPEAIYQPLKYVSSPYGSLATLPEPLRTKAELLKLAILIGKIAVGEWESWDRLEFPPAPVLKRLGIESLSQVIQDTRSDSQEIVNFRPKPSTPKGKNGESKKAAAHAQLTYCNLSPEPVDFLGEIVSSMGIALKICEPDAIEPDEKILVNCIWNPPYLLAARVRPRSGDGALLIVTDESHSETYARLGQVLSLPMSYGSLRSACQRMSHDLRPGVPLAAILSPGAPACVPSPHVGQFDRSC